MEAIGVNLRKARINKKLRQEDLAEKANLSTNYIGAIERGEKIPALETLINIMNILNVSSNVILCDVVKADYDVKASLISEKINSLSDENKENVYAVIETMISRLK